MLEGQGRIQITMYAKFGVAEVAATFVLEREGRVNEGAHDFSGFVEPDRYRF